MHNVAGEIKGAEAAMRYAMEHHIPAITIYHDYEGIAKWCTGAWKANKPGTIAYQRFYQEAAKKVMVHFIKVKGHSNDKYNDMAAFANLFGSGGAPLFSIYRGMKENGKAQTVMNTSFTMLKRRCFDGGWDAVCTAIISAVWSI